MGKSQSLVSAVSRVVSRVSSKGAGLEIKPYAVLPCLTLRLRERLSLFSSVGVALPLGAGLCSLRGVF